MNWYKIAQLNSLPIQKIAFPVEEQRGAHFYTDIGHGTDEYNKRNVSLYETKVKLWAIDQEWKFYDILAADKDGYSGIHPDFMGNELPSRNNIIATGRYDPPTHTATIIYHYGEGSWILPQRVKYLTKRIAQILDRKYNNPRIVVFH